MIYKDIILSPPPDSGELGDFNGADVAARMSTTNNGIVTFLGYYVATNASID